MRTKPLFPSPSPSSRLPRVVFIVWGITGLDYDEIGDTVENVRKGVVLSVGLGALYLAIVTTVLGWWRPAIHEPRKVGGG